jgi:Domain of unknown function (DUF4288)
MRYAANLLFEYGVDGRRSRRPLCEKRIVVFRARSSQEAARRAPRLGKGQELRYRNADGGLFRILFRTARPQSHLKPRAQWSIFRSIPRTIRSAWWAVPSFATRAKSNRPLERTGTQGFRKSKRQQARRSARTGSTLGR